ncbi:MAG TPA: DUF1631 domain-containing protein [Lysobacter sp.]
MSIPFDPFASPQRSTSLASAALPRRVRETLEDLYALLANELARQLEHMLVDYEQQLFRLADQARNPGMQGLHFETLRALRQNRADVVPRFLIGLENSLSRIREAEPIDAETGVVVAPAPIVFRDMRLIDHAEASEDTVVRTMAIRQESRTSLALQLLGQRFGVLAGAPAFDAERLPVGPHQLGRLLQEASEVLHFDTDARLLLLRSFERHVLGGYEPLVEMMNSLLARHNVLPGLSFVPLRKRPRVQPRERSDPLPAANAEAPRTEPLALDPHQAPHTGWMGDTVKSDPVAESAAFDMLQQLLAERRTLLGKLRPAGAIQPKAHEPLPTRQVLNVLGKLQSATPAPRNVGEVRQALLLEGRQQGGEPIALSREDSDTFELLGLLYTEIGRELREGTASSALMERLQVPLLRVALQDREFFVRQQHPARQLLNAVAESGARWLGEDDADPQLGEQLQQAVEHVVENYDGDTKVFEAANHALQEKLHSMARKAEVTERRHVEAARGKEKLVLAKQRAATVLDEAIHGKHLPKFLRTLLSQAWADVLTLTLLRHGEDSDEWRWQLKATAQIVSANSDGPATPEGLDRQIEAALTQVGYHVDEASVIARRLTAGVAEGAGDEDAASRTELAMKLKARARLGEESEAKASPLQPRTAAEEACYGQLRTLPFGTWFEFTSNQQGDVVRRRLAWFSPVTNNALFVNQRGHRIGEHSLDALARMMANGQTQIVSADKGRLVDRAWQATLNALRHLGGRRNPAGKSPRRADA